jgi:hypothetical protein
MPSSNGVYSLPPGYLAATGTTIQVSQHNPIFEDVAAALTARLSRDGTAPMTGVLNLAAGSATAPSLIFTGNVGSGSRASSCISRISKPRESTLAAIGLRLIGMMLPCASSTKKSKFSLRSIARSGALTKHAPLATPVMPAAIRS